FISKYQVLYKIGFGTTATIWMCWDLHRNEYVCMKSIVSGYASVQREITAYEILSKAAKTGTSIGKEYVWLALDHFELRLGEHFLIHEPLGLHLQWFIEKGGGSLPIVYVRMLAIQMLHGLEFIHGAQVIHAVDIQPLNILLRIDDETVLKDAEEAEIKSPSARKITEESVIFACKDLPGPPRRWIGKKSDLVLCDFGEARTGKDSYTDHIIQPPVYRAPEVFLHLPWGTPVDIWNLGCMIWDIMLGRQLFSQHGAPDEETADKNQLARMVALLGPPPGALLADSGPRALNFFNEDGSANRASNSEHPLWPEFDAQTMTVEESEVFLAFIRRTLMWTQEKRPSASKLLKDPWFKCGTRPVNT
ncbi:hypothetical protein M413DRAFT_78930, partial [Hebeloma cylindrosporum]